jgi:hypothetical protein
MLYRLQHFDGTITNVYSFIQYDPQKKIRKAKQLNQYPTKASLGNVCWRWTNTAHFLITSKLLKTAIHLSFIKIANETWRLVETCVSFLEAVAFFLVKWYNLMKTGYVIVRKAHSELQKMIRLNLQLLVTHWPSPASLIIFNMCIQPSVKNKVLLFHRHWINRVK